MDVASTWSTWNALGVVEDYVTGTNGVTDYDLTSADDTITTVGLAFGAAFLAAAIVFVVWLWQARANAEQLCPAPHRRARGWIIGSWICPVVNLWFPFMVVDDVYRASRPTNSPDLFDLRSVPGSRLLANWWAFWLCGLLLDRIAVFIWDNAKSIDGFRSAAFIEVLGTAAFVGAAVTIIRVVLQIGAWQDDRTS